MNNLFSMLRRRRSEIIERAAAKKPEKEAQQMGRRVAHLNARRHKSNRRIKVGFVVQMPEIWNKEAPIYEKMAEDPRFDPWLIVVPSFNLVTNKLGSYGKELEYFQQSYPNAHFLTVSELSEDFRRIKGCGFDYVFYQRCWETYLPEALHTNRVIRFAKTCYVPYAFHCFKAYPQYYHTRFFSSLYLLLCCSSSQERSYPGGSPRKAVFLGFPCLSGLRAEAKPHDRVRLLWTPRWQSDARYGGSTFFTFKDRFFELAARHPELEIVFRPHPLTFENAIKTGQMTQEEVSALLTRCENAGIIFDQNASVDDTLRQTDILLSDFSSILIDAALLGRPIIYTGSKAEAEPDETMRQAMDCMYLADNWEEVTAVLERLLAGDDPNAEARMHLAAQLQKEHDHSTERILQLLLNDAAG